MGNSFAIYHFALFKAVPLNKYLFLKLKTEPLFKGSNSCWTKQVEINLDRQGLGLPTREAQGSD